MAMDHAVMGIPRPPLPEIRSFLPEKKKVPIGWPACLRRSPPKAPQKQNRRRLRTQREKYEFFFYKLDINENTDIKSTPHEEEYDKQNYESVEEQETAL